MGLVLFAIGASLILISPVRIPAFSVLLLGILLLGWNLVVHRNPESIQGIKGMLGAVQSWLGLHGRRGNLLLLGIGLSVSSRAAAGDGTQVISSLALPFWLGGIACTLLALRGTSPTSAPAENSTRLEWLGLVGLTLAALFLRGWQIESMPHVLSGDEGSAGLTGMEFVNGLRNNLLGLGWFSFPALYFWLLSGLQHIFGRSIFAIRILSALAGALAVPATYWLLKGFFGRRAGWLGALWLTCFHAQIFFSRIAYNNIFDSLMFTLILAALWDGLKTNRRNSYLLAGLFVGLSQYFYTTAHVLPLLLIGWIGLLALSRGRRHDLWSHLTAAGIVALSSFMPLLLLYIAHPGEIFFTASRVSMLVPGWIGPAAAALGTTPLGLILEQTWVTALGLSAAELQGVYYGSGVPLLFGLSVPFFYLGLLYCFWRVRDARFNLPLLTLGITFIIGGLSIQAPNAQRMLLLPPVLAMLIVIPLDRAVDWISAQSKRVGLAAGAIAFGLVLVMCTQNIIQLFDRYFPEEVYGSLNGEVTMEMVDILRDESPRQPVFFIGGERMSFNSIPSLPYLLPDVVGLDLEYPYDLPVIEPGSGRELLVFILPGQSQALDLIHERYTPGELSARYNRQGQLLFYLYRFELE